MIVVRWSAIQEPRARLLRKLQANHSRKQQMDIGANIWSADPDIAEAGTNNWEEDVRKLVPVRAGHKGAFTKYETRVDDLVADHADTREKLCEAEELFSTLQNKYKTFLRWDAEIELTIEDDAKLAQEQEAFSDYETIMNIAMARLSALIDNIKTQLKAGHTATASTSSSLPTTGRMRMPKLLMPTFTGAYTNWVSFSDLFKAAVRSSSLFSDSERLNYLKACIKGDAAKIISTLRITDANYPIAWQLLKDR